MSLTKQYREESMQVKCDRVVTPRSGATGLRNPGLDDPTGSEEPTKLLTKRIERLAAMQINQSPLLTQVNWKIGGDANQPIHPPKTTLVRQLSLSKTTT